MAKVIVGFFLGAICTVLCLELYLSSEEYDNSSYLEESESEEYESDYSYDSEEYDEYEEEEEYESVYSNISSYTYSSIDHNCSDFDTQRDAQSFYLANGGPYSNRHDLDRDNDGNACDWNP